VPWASASGPNAGACPGRPRGRTAPPRRASGRGPLFAQLGLEGFEASRARRKLCRRDAPAGRFLPHPARRGRPVLALDEPFASLDCADPAARPRRGWPGIALARDPRDPSSLSHPRLVEERVCAGETASSSDGRPAQAAPWGRACRRGCRAPRRAHRTPAVVALREAGAGDGAAAVRSALASPRLLALLLLGIWEVLRPPRPAVDDFLLPAPHRVAQALWTTRALLWDNFTVIRARWWCWAYAVPPVAPRGLVCRVRSSFLPRTLPRHLRIPWLVGPSRTIPIVSSWRRCSVAWLGVRPGAQAGHHRADLLSSRSR
jgi:hypothetical protein